MQWLGQNPMVLIVIVGAIATTAILAEKVRVHIKQQDNRNSQYDADKLAMSRWQGGVDSDRKKFDDFMTYMRSVVDQILDRLPSRTDAGTSPVRLTDVGEEVSRNAKVKDWVAEHLKEVSQQAMSMSPYDVQQLCFDYANIDNLDNEQKQLAKNAAFKSGVTISEVMRVYAIELRDEILDTTQVDGL